MRSKINFHYYHRNLLRFPGLLVFTIMYIFVIDCVAPVIEVAGYVGGNVTMPCTNNTNRTIRVLYLQRDDQLIDGIHPLINETTLVKKNTRVDLTVPGVHMYNVNVSHEGDYSCRIQFEGKKGMKEFLIHLRLKAPYSSPSHSQQCDDNGHSCHVKCLSQGGYPRAKMEFNVSGENSDGTWKSVNTSEEHDPRTLLFTSSRTVTFNCSRGKQTCTCSVNGSTSAPFSVCASRGESQTFSLIVKVAIGGVLAVLAVLCCASGIVLVWKCKRRQCGQPPNTDIQNKEDVTLDQRDPLMVTTNV